ncbi:MAG: hypothetical protein IPK60_21090 [Sandaracinaceae bacterium]|nr:hypothetical protein [Sandaracinaceae bacterium]
MSASQPHPQQHSMLAVLVIEHAGGMDDAGDALVERDARGRGDGDDGLELGFDGGGTVGGVGVVTAVSPLAYGV